MADEKKTYLIDVKSNLDEYAKKAAKAEEAVHKFYQENVRILTQSDKNSAEFQKVNAQYQALKTEARNASKEAQTFAKALNSETGSRKQLNEVLKLQRNALGELARNQIVEINGIKQINPEFIKMRNNVKKTQEEIIKYDQAIKDGRSNVGNYTGSINEALGSFQMMPGVMGQAGFAVQRFGTTLKALALNPIVLVITAIVGAIGLLVKAFKNSQPLMDAFHKVSAAIGATLKVLLDRISNFAEFLGSIFNKELRESRKEARALNDELLGIDDTMSKAEQRQIRRKARKGVIAEIKEEAKAAYDLEKAEQVLEDREIAFIQRRAEMKRQIEELFTSTKDENLSDQQRIANLDQAIALTKELNATEIGFAKERARITKERTEQGNSTREEIRANEEAQAHAAELEAQGFKEEKRLMSERFSLIRRSTKEDETAAKARAAAAEKEMNESKARLTKEIEDYKAFLDKQKELDEKAADEKRQREDELAQERLQRELTYQENLLAMREANGDNEFAIQRERLRMQMEEELRVKGLTENEKAVITRKYEAFQAELTQMEIQARLQAYQSFAGNLAQLFGENTAIGRAAAAVQTTIATYTAAMEAYKSLAGIPIVGPALGAAAAAVAVATGLKNVRKILSTKSGLPGDSGVGSSAPTAITSTIPAQRAFAPAVVYNTPAATQTQINALPNQPAATAEDIAAAFAKIPAPIVTVEDINARAKEVNKVTVRGTI